MMRSLKVSQQSIICHHWKDIDLKKKLFSGEWGARKKTAKKPPLLIRSRATGFYLRSKISKKAHQRASRIRRVFRVFRRVVYLRNRRLPLKWGKSSVLYLCIQKCAQKMPPIKKKKRTKVDRNFGEQGTVRKFILKKQLMKVSGLNSSLLKYTNCKIKHLKLFTA